MKIKRVEHIAIAVKDYEGAKRIFEDAFGLIMEHEEELAEYSTKLSLYPIGMTYLEFLTSDGSSGVTANWLKEHGDGLWHICLEVEDIRGALAELKQKGIKLIDEEPRPGHGGNLIAFVNPESTSNVLIELVEMSEDVVR